MSVLTFQPLIVIYRRGNFVYHHGGFTTSIFENVLSLDLKRVVKLQGKEKQEGHEIPQTYVRNLEISKTVKIFQIIKITNKMFIVGVGSLVSLYVKPRQCAKKNIYVIGGKIFLYNSLCQSVCNAIWVM